MKTREELGCAGHFISSRRCAWRRHTQVTRDDGTGVRVSSVGNYAPDDKGRDTVGVGEDDLFETMVFAVTATPVAESEGCGCHKVVSWTELSCARYASAGQAQVGHEQVVASAMSGEFDEN